VETTEDSATEALPVPSLSLPDIPETTTMQEPASAEDSRSEASQTEVLQEDQEEATYESPVDFEELWAINPDVVAWLYIPGANISMPILQHPTDNSYYLTHDAQKQSSSAGAIFIEDYNAADFTDMCTVVYGHRMYSGEMFGTLQATYSDETSFAESQYIAIYLPDREIVYQVFGAVPYDNSHILYYHDFDDQLSYRKFINTIYSTTGIDATLVEDLKPQYGDKLLILSTCLWGDKDNRYLVLAKELTE
jgi:sortase B